MATSHGRTGFPAAVLAAACAVVLAGCPSDGSSPPGTVDAGAFVVTTDFETGAFALLDPVSRTATPIVGILHSDAVARVRGDRVYVLNRLGQDNLTVLDASDGFRVVYQVSTDPGSNPQDIAFASDGKAYVTRLEVATVLVIDPRDGSRLGEVDCSALADADGVAEMSSAAAVGDRIVLAAGRLDRNDLYLPTGPGALAVIDPATDRIERVVELTGANPYGDMNVDPAGRLLVAAVGRFGTLDGGIERVDVEGGASEGFLVTEETLGGDVTSFVVGPGGVLWIVLSDPSFATSVVRYDPADGSVRRIADAPGFSYACVAFVTDDVLAVCDRTRTLPGVRLFDGTTGLELTTTPVSVGLPPSQIRRLR